MFVSHSSENEDSDELVADGEFIICLGSNRSL